MKKIKKLPALPDGLARFIADASAPKTWNEFGGYESGSAKRELTRLLVARQHRLCAYCEILLIDDDTRIEHFIPKSDPERGERHAFDSNNLLAVCKGGTNRNFAGDAVSPDPARYLPPARANLSCDAAKGALEESLFLDPRQTPASPSLFVIGSDGRIQANSASCNYHEVDWTIVDRHINGLRLNVGRLSNQREAIWSGLSDAYVECASLPGETGPLIVALAERFLLPDSDDVLSQFFTTARSFFGELAETILTRPPHAWI